jgi:hypothetical protein
MILITGSEMGDTRVDDSTGKLLDCLRYPRLESNTMPVDSETVPIGSQAPDFSLTSIDGSEVTLSALRGNPVVLVFLRGFM